VYGSRNPESKSVSSYTRRLTCPPDHLQTSPLADLWAFCSSLTGQYRRQISPPKKPNLNPGPSGGHPPTLFCATVPNPLQELGPFTKGSPRQDGDTRVSITLPLGVRGFPTRPADRRASTFQTAPTWRCRLAWDPPLATYYFYYPHRASCLCMPSSIQRAPASVWRDTLKIADPSPPRT
jgi:hypothetical protein